MNEALHFLCAQPNQQLHYYTDTLLVDTVRQSDFCSVLLCEINETEQQVSSREATDCMTRRRAVCLKVEVHAWNKGDVTGARLMLHKAQYKHHSVLAAAASLFFPRLFISFLLSETFSQCCVCLWRTGRASHDICGEFPIYSTVACELRTATGSSWTEHVSVTQQGQLLNLRGARA